MASLEPKKLALLRIWQILLKHSDYDHPLTQEEIIKYLESDYGIEMELIGAEASADLAVLRVPTASLKAINPDVKAVELADEYHVGETVFAIGNTNDGGISVTEGIVSVDNEYISLDIDTVRSYRSIRIDAYSNHGNSGGGLFNAAGKLIGINNAGGDFEHENYSIPIAIVKGMADNLIHYYEDGNPETKDAYNIKLGITIVEANSKFVLNASTGFGKIETDVVVTGVSGIAQGLGLVANDVVDYIKVNGNKFVIDRNFDVGDVLLTVRAGDSIVVGYQRAGDSTVETGEYVIQSSDLKAIN